MTLARLGQLDRVVACTRYCRDLVPGVSDGDRCIVADSWTAQSQQILAARPDLVIASVPYQLEAVAEILKAGIRFLGLAPRTLADVYADIAMVAGVMSVPERGRDVIAEMQQAITRVQEQVRTAEGGRATRPRVFCEEWGKPIIASQPWVHEMVEAGGGEFLGEPGAKRSAAAVLAEDPEVLVAAWCGAGDRVPLEKLVRERGWDEMTAVRTGRVFSIRDELLNTPAPTLVEGLKALVAAIHPELFPGHPGLRHMSERRGTARQHLERP